jgi:hypothetical protein
MGWGGGSRITSDVVRGLRKRKVPAEQRQLFYEILIPALEDCDWDNVDECRGDDPALDAAVRSIHPDWEFED